MKILMILTSHDELGNTGDKTGFWLEEFASPYYVFKDEKLRERIIVMGKTIGVLPDPERTCRMIERTPSILKYVDKCILQE